MGGCLFIFARKKIVHQRNKETKSSTDTEQKYCDSKKNNLMNMEELDDLIGNTVLADDVQALSIFIEEIGLSSDYWVQTNPESSLNQGKQWRTLLMLAADLNKKEVAKYLIDVGAKINTQLQCGSTALHLSVAKKHKFVIYKLLQSNQCDINLKNENGKTALHMVAQRGSVAILKELLILGAEVNCQVTEQYTPLAYAVESRCLEKVNLLLTHGAQVNYKSLSLAVKQRHLPILNTLLQNNPCENDIHSVFIEASLIAEDIVNVLLPYVKNIDWQCKLTRNTALHHVCKTGNDKIAKLLLDHNCKINILNNNKETPLYLACIHFKYKVARLLLQAGCDPKIKYLSQSLIMTTINKKENSNKKSVMLNKLQTVCLLLMAGCNISCDSSFRKYLVELFTSFKPMILIYKPVFDKIFEIIKSPLTLQELCFNAIRGEMNSGFVIKVDTLRFPTILKYVIKYTYLNEIQDFKNYVLTEH